MPCSRNSTETLESPYPLFLFLRSERRILVGVIEAPSNSASLGSSDHKSGVSRSLLTSLSRLLMRGGICPGICFVWPSRAVPGYEPPGIVRYVAANDEIRVRPLVFDPDFRIAVLEIEVFWVESGYGSWVC